MRLKQLKLKGFKSFANETLINFNEDVIGIVGPNGSGKSNVVDAIRWVLGEQKSKELRLEAMADVIFNGTKTKKEAPSATVELTFENNKGILPTEYQHVSIARTLYRSGESEYRLNDVVCRLKDIKSLFLDTGIGSNSYAIISLGMVDDLLYDKDDSRRSMFEQAAGVSKYKSRKKETLNKLNSTNQDLDRVADLLFEIEGNMKTLEKQAKRTRKYFDIKEEYKGLAIQNAARSMVALKQNYKKTETDITTKQDEYNVINTNVRSKEAELESIKKTYLEQELNVSQKQKELNELVANVRNYENDKSLLIQKINFKSQSLHNLEHLIEDNKKNLDVLQLEISTLEEKLNAEKSIESNLSDILAKAKDTLEGARQVQGNAKSEFESKTKRIQQLQKELFEIDKEIAIAGNTIDSHKAEIARTQDQNHIYANEKITLENNLSTTAGDYDLRVQELASLKDKEAQRKTKIVSLEHNRDQLTEEVGKINRSIDARQNEYDLLKAMIENYEGFPESMKFLSTNWQKAVPVLSDLLDVSEDHKSVIEQFLEPYLTYFVVNNINEAAEAIKLLTGSQKGKASFFLLDKIASSDHVPLTVPMAKPAVDYIKVDAKYEKLINYLLNNTYIYHGNLDEFMVEKEHEHLNFLSNNGSFYKTKISVSGGSVGLFEGKKIGRKKNLEKLETQIQESTSRKNKLSEDLTSIKNELLQLKGDDKGMEIDLLHKDLNKIEQEKTRAQVSLENLLAKLLESESKQARSTNIIAQNENNLTQFEIRKVDIKQELENEDAGIKSSNSDLDSLTDALNRASEHYNASNIEYIKQQNHIGNIQKDFDFKKSRSVELEQRIESEILQQKTDQAELSEAENLKIDTEQKLVDAYHSKENFQSNLNESEQGYYTARNVITTLEEEIRLLNRGINQYQSEINTLKDTYQEMKFQINAIGDRIYIEFNIPLDDLMATPVDEAITDEDLSSKVEQLKNRIHNYGEINPMAMEAYEEIKARYDVISVQKDDIVKAKESLLETINEIETSATSQFMQAFEEIRGNFITVFRSLFTEDDNCDLILLQPENPLESEIEIIAKPKGKKPKSISQLSGGEKTLTATALLFALYLLKPAPFCIFDEVDAPLDDANIQKFNKIIKKFAEKSQFIIVTHNKSTMAAVNTLYGIFMKEMGISGLTQVDFSNMKEDPVFEELIAN